MNSILVCICGIVLTVLKVNANDQDSDKPQANILRRPFYFGYKRGDYLDATVKLINLSPDVVYQIKYREERQTTEQKSIEQSAGRGHYLVHHQLLKKDINVQIKLLNKNNWCIDIVIIRGKALDSNETSRPEFNYNEQCLRSSSQCILEVNLKDKCLDTPQADVLRPTFHFGYSKGDYLNAVVNFINLSPAMRYIIYNIVDNEGYSSPRALDKSSGRNYYYSVHQQLLNGTSTSLYVVVQFDIYWCANVNLFDGRAVDSDAAASPEYNYNAVCSRSNSPCYMEVDMRNVCLDDNTKMKTSLHEDMETTTVISTTSVTSPIVSDNITSMSNASTSPHEDMETTTVISSASVTNKPDESTSSTTNVIVIIVSSLSGITFVVFVVIASWKRCWMRRSPQGTLGLQTNQDNFEPFYLNLLFRRECEREITEIEGHDYEEIDPPIYEEIAPTIDEEIDPPAAGGGRG